MTINLENLEDVFFSPNPKEYLNERFTLEEISEADKLFKELSSNEVEYKNMNKKDLLGIGFYKESSITSACTNYDDRYEYFITKNIKFAWDPFSIKKENLVSLADPLLRKNVDILFYSFKIDLSKRIDKKIEYTSGTESKSFLDYLPIFKKSSLKDKKKDERKKRVTEKFRYITFEAKRFNSLDGATFLLTPETKIIPLYLEQYKKIESLMKKRE